MIRMIFLLAFAAFCLGATVYCVFHATRALWMMM